jgi:hypothetical protein
MSLVEGEHQLVFHHLAADLWDESVRVSGKGTAQVKVLDVKVTIAIQPLAMTFDYITIPKVTPAVFVRGKAANQTAYPLLPGQVNVFFENDFVSQGRIGAVAPNDTFEIDRQKRIKWLVQLKPGQTIKLPLKYAVEYPSKERVLAIK